MSGLEELDREKAIEGLVEKLRVALSEGGSVNAADGMSATLLFTSRLAKALILCSKTAVDRDTNLATICEALRGIADDLEEESGQSGPLTMH